MFLVFERLNTTSTPLSQQEIRACVYHGPFNDYLHRANTNQDWRQIYGDVSLRQKDKELLLRFCALYFDPDAYERPMKVFLSDFMRKNRHLELYDAATLDEAFLPTVKLANSALGRNAFRPQRALNASVTDAILVGTARRLTVSPVNDKDLYAERVQEVLQDHQFADMYTVGTTNKDKVLGRIARVTDILRDGGS